jgi:NADH:ubiquinone oxidoreductase subunit 5 (subunit L)/multisubunit Na+/H+ antiporter MnhA subunit
MIMIIIIGVIGSLITVYALGYMEDFQRLDKDFLTGALISSL